MIQMQISSEFPPISQPMVFRLRTIIPKDPQELDNCDAVLISEEDHFSEFDLQGFSIRLKLENVHDFDGDVILAVPGRKSVHRLVRSQSKHNTFLVTEQCDQKCVMCSQPPKKHHQDLFDCFLDAVRLAPIGATIGISGGEPMLHKDRLFHFLIKSQKLRPDVRFHILTNGQHFTSGDQRTLSLLDLRSILWGIPIYSADAEIHDRIVAKTGAHEVLLQNLAFLGSVGGLIELRTVLLRSNVQGLASLADHITTFQPFAHYWAIMQLENIGYGRMNWAGEFYDNSVAFDPIAKSIDLATARGIPPSLFNFPLCTVPDDYRPNCFASISDWKQKFIHECRGCALRSTCGGFFEWYPEDNGFSRIAAQ
ncbi:His-Xaa-Ser system radical SAM maturase HxsC [Shimia gijangensis]|uniref:His-Xaa-Ser system radical SAM maturase HxsC n=1 Tax=Shimia gijangensis TaxID=1470563 RepID=A0A1M6TUS9_9RHOB|nr:His-Xaa-Ser system radical SAM maturase HxsC [Shimia gijangensis]SHK60653.1 His-Xaa-Ser system radical SAM maturase HxsC [Shimia gijangensis]